jgi:hypothetical protein
MQNLVVTEGEKGKYYVVAGARRLAAMNALQKTGKLPKGMCLKCLDGNRHNADPDNWTPIPRGALPFLNGHRGHNYEEMPTELKPTVLALAKLKYAKRAAGKRKDKDSAGASV